MSKGEQSMSSVPAGDGMTDISQSSRGAPDFSAVATKYMKTHGVPGKLNEADFTRKFNNICTLVNARSASQKEEVRNCLTYLGIVHGTGPNVAWEDINFEPEGCKAVRMNEVIDRIVTRKYCRRFFAWFGQRAISMHDASPDLQLVLQERAMRNGIPITETASVIDFVASGEGVAPATMLYRTQAKYSAVKRNNNNGMNSLDKTAGTASTAMHKYNDDNDSYAGL